MIDHIKVKIENDDKFICDDCRQWKKDCYTFSRYGYVYLCICNTCYDLIMSKIDLRKEYIHNDIITDKKTVKLSLTKGVIENEVQ